MTVTVDCGSFCSSWLPCRMVRQSSQGSPNILSINEPELVEAICDHVANCITPQWPPAKQKMKRHVSTRPYFNNTVERISSLTDAVNGKVIDLGAMIIERIVSGGQSGADRAALDWAIANNIAHGGWCPNGRKAEDGRIADCYDLCETPGSGYRVRTEWNVRDSDVTVIFSMAGELTGGSLLTRGFARKWNRPCLHVSRDKTCDPAGKLLEFIEESGARTVNVAGPRQSNEPDVAGFLAAVLDAAFGGKLESV